MPIMTPADCVELGLLRTDGKPVDDRRCAVLELLADQGWLTDDAVKTLNPLPRFNELLDGLRVAQEAVDAFDLVSNDEESSSRFADLEAERNKWRRLLVEYVRDNAAALLATDQEP